MDVHECTLSPWGGCLLQRTGSSMMLVRRDLRTSLSVSMVAAPSGAVLLKASCTMASCVPTHGEE